METNSLGLPRADQPDYKAAATALALMLTDTLDEVAELRAVIDDAKREARGMTFSIPNLVALRGGIILNILNGGAA